MKTDKTFIAAALALAGIAGAGATTLQLPPESDGQQAAKTKPAEASARKGEALPDSIEGNTYDLDDLVVTGETPKIQSDGAKLTYNINQDDSAQASTVLDVLRKVPMVTVDAQDNIRVKGDTNFKVYVNGKENPMLSQNSGVILKSMPAASVKKIEVITDPGAKYDAEGTGGIINLVFEDMQSFDKGDGYAGSLSAAFGRQQNAMLSAYGMAKKKKLTVSVNGTYMNGHIFPQENRNHSVTDYRGGMVSGRLEQDYDQRIMFDYGQAALNMSYEPDSNNLFTLSANFMDMEADIDKITAAETRYDAASNRLWHTLSNKSGTLGRLSASGQGSYQHNFAPEQNNLVVSYMFNFGRNKIDLDTRYDELNGLTLPLIGKTGQDNLDREHTVQADYTNGFGTGKHLLETGVKGIFRRNGSYSAGSAGESADDLHGTSRVDLTQIQDVYAAYGSYTGTFGPVSTRAGVRYEHTVLGIDYKTAGTDFRSHLNDIVPNASVSYSFDMMTNLRLAYQMRITRPSVQQLTPFKLEMINWQVQCGNPDLKSERNNRIDLSFQKFGRLIGGSISAGYSLTDNMISDWTYLEHTQGQSQPTTVTTYGNLGKRQSFTLNGFLNYNIIAGMSATLSAGAEYVNLNARSIAARNHGWSYNFNASWNYRTSSDWIFQAYGGLMSRRIELQGTGTGFHWYGIGMGKDFLKSKNLNVMVTANNFFEDRVTYTSKTHTPEYIQTGHFTMKTWSAGITLTWKFGNMQGSQVRKTNAEIRNDDVSSGKDNSKGGGGIGI